MNLVCGRYPNAGYMARSRLVPGLEKAKGLVDLGFDLGAARV